MADEDARLTDFVGTDDEDAPSGGDRGAAGGDGDATAEEAAGADPQGAADEPAARDDDAEDADTPGVDPVEPTATWAPGGACEDCGDAVERRWRDGDALVCAGCKDW